MSNADSDQLEEAMRRLQLSGMFMYLSAFVVQFVVMVRCIVIGFRRGNFREDYAAPPVAGLSVWLALGAACAWLIWSVTLAQLREARGEAARNPTWPLITANALALFSTTALAISITAIAPQRSWLPSCNSARCRRRRRGVDADAQKSASN